MTPCRLCRAHPASIDGMCADCEHAASYGTEKAEAEVVRLRASLAGLIACVHVATQRGWPQKAVDAIIEAADNAQGVLPPFGAGDDRSNDR